MEPIEQIYKRFLEEDKRFWKNWEYDPENTENPPEKSEKLKKLEKELEDHPNYREFYPYDDYLRDVPDDVVEKYLDDISEWINPQIIERVTTDFLRKIMQDCVTGMHVFDLDLRVIVDKGWHCHALTDSGPRSGICEDIEIFFDE